MFWLGLHYFLARKTMTPLKAFTFLKKENYKKPSLDGNVFPINLTALMPGCVGSGAKPSGGHGARLWQPSQSLGPVIWCLCFQKNFLQLFPLGAIQTLPSLAQVKTPVWLQCRSLRPHRALRSPCRAHRAGCRHLCAAGLGRGEQASRIYLRNTLL